VTDLSMWFFVVVGMMVGCSLLAAGRLVAGLVRP